MLSVFFGNLRGESKDLLKVQTKEVDDTIDYGLESEFGWGNLPDKKKHADPRICFLFLLNVGGLLQVTRLQRGPSWNVLWGIWSTSPHLPVTDKCKYKSRF